MNLIAAAIIGIAVIVLLIAACKVHPFLSLLAGSFVMALSLIHISEPTRH